MRSTFSHAPVWCQKNNSMSNHALKCYFIFTETVHVITKAQSSKNTSFQITAPIKWSNIHIVKINCPQGPYQFTDQNFLSVWAQAEGCSCVLGCMCMCIRSEVNLRCLFLKCQKNKYVIVLDKVSQWPGMSQVNEAGLPLSSQGPVCFHFPSPGITSICHDISFFLMGSGESNSGPHSYRVSTSPTD